jgi:hypothetical protein
LETQLVFIRLEVRATFAAAAPKSSVRSGTDALLDLWRTSFFMIDSPVLKRDAVVRRSPPKTLKLRVELIVMVLTRAETGPRGSEITSRLSSDLCRTGFDRVRVEEIWTLHSLPFCSGRAIQRLAKSC